MYDRECPGKPRVALHSRVRSNSLEIEFYKSEKGETYRRCAKETLPSCRTRDVGPWWSHRSDTTAESSSLSPGHAVTQSSTRRQRRVPLSCCDGV